MELVEDLVSRADELFSLGENANDVEGMVSKFNDGITNLLKALLTHHQRDVVGDYSRLCNACLEVEPGLVEIEAELQLFEIESAIEDREDLIDAANEIWDWIIGILDQAE